MLLAHGADPNAASVSEWSARPLHLAVERARVSGPAGAAIAELRLRDGADPNLPDGQGLTALHRCVVDCDVGVLHVLLDHGARVDARDDRGLTPLHHASSWASPAIVAELLRSGADPSSEDTSGRRPADIAGSRLGRVADMSRDDARRRQDVLDALSAQ